MKATKKIVLDEDLSKVGPALRRAAKQARKMAKQTNTPLVVYEQGRVIRKTVEKERGGKRHKAMFKVRKRSFSEHITDEFH